MSPAVNLRDKVHKRLRTRTLLYFIISILILAISIFHIIKDGASILFSFAGFLAGTLIGIIVSRMFKISWDENAEQVISTFDVVGVIVLLLYIVFELFRTRIVGHLVNASSVLAVSFAVLAGLMFGRVLGIRGKIRSVFKEQGLIE